ncbi:hypothetical protein GCM10010340_35040 [Streptomyces griseoloalbus]|nr:hypothetical protein GCM10010340_35040 [Streptomyces albaduncus]
MLLAATFGEQVSSRLIRYRSRCRTRSSSTRRGGDPSRSRSRRRRRRDCHWLVAVRWVPSSSTLPTLIATMYRHAMLDAGSHTLATGTGYGTALACRRLGDELVTSVEVDPYRVKAATDRLAGIGLHPRTAVCDITGPLPGDVDRIVATVSVRPVPASWLTALRPEGRLVTTITGTAMILVADKTPDGGARGFICCDHATFMRTRHGDGYDDAPPAAEVWQAADEDGETSISRYPLTYVPDSWSVHATPELEAPGIEHRGEQHEGSGRTVWMAHPDGCWTRASTESPRDLPTVHQGGPRPPVGPADRRPRPPRHRRGAAHDRGPRPDHP